MSLEDIVVVDAGSFEFDAGFAANLPSEKEPSVVGPLELCLTRKPLLARNGTCRNNEQSDTKEARSLYSANQATLAM